MPKEKTQSSKRRGVLGGLWRSDDRRALYSPDPTRHLAKLPPHAEFVSDHIIQRVADMATRWVRLIDVSQTIPVEIDLPEHSLEIRDQLLTAGIDQRRRAPAWLWSIALTQLTGSVTARIRGENTHGCQSYRDNG